MFTKTALLEPRAAEEPQNPYLKRREQVRRAQKYHVPCFNTSYSFNFRTRTHRERKEAYIKSLEAEVVQLRANETRLFQETKTLYAELMAMKNLLANNGIPVPSGPLPQLPSPNGTLSKPESRIDELDQLFEFSLTESVPKQPQERIHVRRQVQRQHSTSATTFDAIFTRPANTIVSQQDPTATGIDFVLRYALLSPASHIILTCCYRSLEAPCLGHIPTTLDYEEPSGHALMTSTTLLHHHQHHTFSTDQIQTSSSTWTLPESSVERLLELSSSIPLDDSEVTPVQAWDYIRCHPQYGVLDSARLEQLKKTLVLHVKCFG